MACYWNGIDFCDQAGLGSIPDAQALLLLGSSRQCSYVHMPIKCIYNPALFRWPVGQLCIYRYIRNTVFSPVFSVCKHHFGHSSYTAATLFLALMASPAVTVYIRSAPDHHLHRLKARAVYKTSDCMVTTHMGKMLTLQKTAAFDELHRSIHSTVDKNMGSA